MKKQLFIWYKNQSTIPATAIVGSVANGMYVLAREDGSLYVDMYSKATETYVETQTIHSSGAVASGDVSTLTAENDQGVTAFIWTDFTDYYLTVITLVSGAMDIQTNVLPRGDQPRRFYVSGDGTEFVVDAGYGPRYLTGYDSTATVVWEHQPWVLDLTQRVDGYVASVPRAGRYVFVNQSLPTFINEYNIDHDTPTGSNPISWGIFTNPNDIGDYTGATVISTTLSMRIDWMGRTDLGAHPVSTDVDPLYLDGVSFAASQSATWFNMGGFDDVTFVSGSITLPSPGPWSASVDSYNMGVSGEYWAAQDNWLSLVTVTVDNTSAHGGYLELRDDTGAILDSLAYTEDNEVTRWVGTGSNTATYFIGTRTPMD